jgi:hypothetical protein
MEEKAAGTMSSAQLNALHALAFTHRGLFPEHQKSRFFFNAARAVLL